MQNARRSARQLVIATALFATLSAAALAGEEPERETIGPMIDGGDPLAVPVLLDWLTSAASKPLDVGQLRFENLSELFNVTGDCSMYELEEAGPQMVRLYRALPPGDLGSLPNLVRAAARYRSASARSFQWTLLNNARVADDFQRIGLLRALVEGGDARAVEALAAFVEAQLRRVAQQQAASGQLASTVSLVRSAAFIDRVTRIVPPEDVGAARTLASLRERLALNNRPASALMDAVERASTASTPEVSDALLELARAGEVSDLDRLSALPLGAGDALRENDRLTAWRDDAVASIRRRHWRELSGATRPTTERRIK